MLAKALLSVLALSASACGRDDVPRSYAEARGNEAGEVTIHVPDKLTSIETEADDGLGKPVRIACATCHTIKAEAEMPESAADLVQFHTGMTFAHGQVPCASCHVVRPGKAPSLHLADGREVPMTDAMDLCAQCHGPQFRDYGHGAHGGMNGAWDLSRGSRERNHCVDCHDPHLPRIPRVLPAPRARDRAPLAGEGAPDHG